MGSHLIVAPGSINVDLILKTDVLKGPKTFQGAYTESQGGKGSNQAIAARRAATGRAIAHINGSAADRLVYLVGCVGDDPWGDAALQVLNDTGVCTDHVRVDPTIRTGVVMEYLYGDGEVTIALDLGANARVTPRAIDTAGDLIDSAALLLAQIENPLQALAHAVSRAARAGVPTMLDPSVIPAEAGERQRLFNTVIPHIDIIAPNRSEALALTGVAITDDASALAAATALREHAGIVLITRGADGALITRGDDHHFVRRLPVHAQDGGAAGDTFRGAWALALVEALEAADGALADLPFDALVKATHFGNAAAALCVSRAGAAPSIPWRQEIDALLVSQSTIREAAS